MTHQPENRVARFGGGGASGIRGNVLRPAFGVLRRGTGKGIVFGGDVEPIDFEFRERAENNPQEWWLTAEQFNVATMAWTLRRPMIQVNNPPAGAGGLSYLAGCEDGNTGRVFSFSGFTREWFTTWRGVYVALVQKFDPIQDAWEAWASHHLVGGLGRRVMAIPESRDQAGNADRIWIHGGVPPGTLPSMNQSAETMQSVSRTTKTVTRMTDSSRGLAEYMAGVLPGRNIYYFGGVSAKTFFPNLSPPGVYGEYRSYNMPSDVWVDHGANGLLGLYETAGGVIGEEIAIVGGETFPEDDDLSNPNGFARNLSIRYSAIANVFAITASALTVPRRGAAAFVTGSADRQQLHVIGGGPGITAGRTYETLTNLLTGSWVQGGADMSVNRAHHGASFL